MGEPELTRFPVQPYKQALLAPYPFWATLSPTAVKQRIEHLLDAPDSAALVQALSPVEYTVLLKESPETRVALLQLGNPEQIRTVLDLDCWNKDTLQSSQVLAWLEELRQSGEEVFLPALYTMDRELLLVTFRRHIRVQAVVPEEEEMEPRPYDEVLSNELYYVEFRDPESPLNEQIVQCLRVLRLTDIDLYHTLMQGTMWAQESDLEEWAYRWKTGRLQDEGFPEYLEALEIFHAANLHLPAPPVVSSPETPGVPLSAEETGVIPSYAWSFTPANSALAQALDSEFDSKTLERLCWEMVALCNAALVLDQVDFADAVAVRTSLGRVHAYVNLGLEYLSGHQQQPYAAILVAHTLQTICQVGFTLSIRLRQRAEYVQMLLRQGGGLRRDLPGLARQVLDGLLHEQHPQFFVGLEQPGECSYRYFLHLRDVMCVDPILLRLENDPAYQPALLRTSA